MRKRFQASGSNFLGLAMMTIFRFFLRCGMFWNGQHRGRGVLVWCHFLVCSCLFVLVVGGHAFGESFGT